jgi:UDP-N-acetylmuramate dehydrogenase
MQILKNINLKDFNSYRLSITADIAYFPESVDDLKTIYNGYSADNFFIIGGGNNIILASETFEKKKFIILRENFNKCEVEGNDIRVLSGTSLKELSETACKNGLSGLEIFYDIPGTVGGAIWMNAGAYGECFFDYVYQVEVLNKKTSQVEIIPGEEICHGYRYSQFQDNEKVILSAIMRLKPGNKENINQKMQEIYNLRNEKLPKEYPSAGSVFKRPPDGFPVGMMVEQLGLKGYSIGGARISEKHGGFIINYDNAKPSDIIQLIELIMEKVQKNYGFELHLEQIIVKD